MTVVLDASVTIAWIYLEQQTPAIRAIFAEPAPLLFLVPRLWHLEAVNVLLNNARRGKHDKRFVRDSLNDLLALRLVVDERTEEQCWTITTDLAIEHGFTAYDASYLELAMRLNAPLATLDQDLRRAASAEGVPLLGM